MPIINSSSHRPASLLKRCSGFTLLEVMVAMVIFSIGLLGLASLQGQSLQFSHSAYLKSQATFYAYDVLDKMRANRAIALTGNYNATFSSTGSDNGCYSNTGDCSAEAMALHDIFNWKQLLATLPDGQGSVDAFPSASFTEYLVTVTWSDRSAPEGSGGTETITVRSEI